MTATVKDPLNSATKVKKINYTKKYPIWVYVVLGLGLAGLVVAIVTTALVSNVYWAYSHVVFSKPSLHGTGTEAIGPNDIWKLILINPAFFQADSGIYKGIPVPEGHTETLALAGYEQFETWCSNHGYAPFMDEDLFNRYLDFFSNGTKFDSALAARLWNPHANAYYITTCIFWIVSMITLAIIFFNWWGYIVKQIKANQLPKAERIAAKKAKKEAIALAIRRKNKIKLLKQHNLWDKMVSNIKSHHHHHQDETGDQPSLGADVVDSPDSPTPSPVNSGGSNQGNIAHITTPNGITTSHSDLKHKNSKGANVWLV